MRTDRKRDGDFSENLSFPREKGTLVSIPQKLWDDILDLLGDYEVCRWHGGNDLLQRIRQHFDGAEELG